MQPEQQRVVPKHCPVCASTRLRTRTTAGMVFFRCDVCKMTHHG